MSTRNLILILIVLVAGCKSATKDSAKLNIIIFGYDSIACYYGSSTELSELRYGKITDSLFIDTVLTSARDRNPGIIALKPGGGAGVLGNWEQLDTLFKLNNFTNTKIDTLDEKEQTFFKTTSIITFLKEHQEPLKLFLPKEENENTEAPSDKTLTVLLLNENEVYAYNGANIKSGSKYSFKDLEAYLKTKKSSSDFIVRIKPGEKSTYQSTVDMLDLITTTKIKNYKMEDPTKEEQALMNELLSN